MNVVISSTIFHSVQFKTGILIYLLALISLYRVIYLTSTSPPPFFRCSLPKAMSISRSEILRKKKAAAETEVEKLPSVKVLESVS